MKAHDRHARHERNNRRLLVAALIAIAMAALSCLVTGIDNERAMRPTTAGRYA